MQNRLHDAPTEECNCFICGLLRGLDTSFAEINKQMAETRRQVEHYARFLHHSGGPLPPQPDKPVDKQDTGFLL